MTTLDTQLDTGKAKIHHSDRKIMTKKLGVVMLLVVSFICLCVYGYSYTIKKQALEKSQRKSGGVLTLGIKSRSLLRATPPLNDHEVQMDIAVGRSFFINPWVIPPASTTARDGLGPLFNARTCKGCHRGGGRGRAPESGEPMRHMLVRLSLPGTHTKLGVRPDPQYGTQFQSLGIQRGSNRLESAINEGLKGKSIGEVQIETSYQTINGKYPDGETYQLQKPIFRLEQPAYGELAESMLISPRIGPSLAGSGLIGEIPPQAILALADPQDSNGDGISGKANKVWSQEKQKTVLGVYGLKANSPDLKQQVADAFVNDLGITSTIFPRENCGEKQLACLNAPHGNGPDTTHEISDDLLAKVVNYTRFFVVPAARKKSKTIKAGEKYFQQSGCVNCHQPDFVTKKDASHPELASQHIWPYSDFLLHDMGKALADNRPDFKASGSEWRTAPLWGIRWRQYQGKFNNYLHDGRARSVEEAILWHGGEAEAAKQAFMQLKKKQRKALIRFVESR